VDVGQQRSFVMADIPGLIEGAAEGAGLGHRFLKHLQRTRVLLHLIDIAPPDPAADPVKDAKSIIEELKKYSADLALKPRWLVLNKKDLLPEEAAKIRAAQIVKKLRFTGPVFLISGATGDGTKGLCEAVMKLLEDVRAGRLEADDELRQRPKPAAKKQSAVKKPVKKKAARKQPARKEAKVSKQVKKKVAVRKVKAPVRKKKARR
jgi:GTP-binding protein